MKNQKKYCLDIALFLLTIFLVSCSTTGGQEKYQERFKDLSRYIEREKDDFYGGDSIKVNVLRQSLPVKFNDPQEKLTWNAWSGAPEGCKFTGGGIFGTSFQLQYRLAPQRSKATVYMMTANTALVPQYSDYYAIKVGDNEPIRLNQTSGSWTERKPEVVFGTETSKYINNSTLKTDHIKILEQLSEQEKKELTNVVYKIRREGIDSLRNGYHEDSDCRVGNNGRFTYMLEEVQKVMGKFEE